MIISKSELPSRGYLVKKDYNPELFPLTFIQILNYVNTPETSEMKKLLKDIVTLESMGLDSANVSFLDLEYLIFMYKALTINDNIQFNSTTRCSDCGKIVKFDFRLEDVTFIDFDEDNRIPKQVVLSGEKFDIVVPTLDKIKKYLSDAIAITPDLDLTVFRLYVLFKEFDSNPGKIINLVNNSIRQDAVTLLNLDNLCYGRVNPIQYSCTCNSVSKYSTIELSALVENFFGTLVRNYSDHRDTILS